MKRGTIIVNAFDRRENVLHQSKRLKEEFERRGVAADILPSGFLCSTDGNIATSLGGYDFCVFLDKDKYASVMLEKAGLRLFNSAASIAACDDKMLTFICLSGLGIPMPKTFPAPLCYMEGEGLSPSMLDYLEGELGYPMVAKAAYGSLGREVYKIDGREELERVSSELIGRPHLYQKFIAASAGRDIRVTVIGGKAVAAMMRTNDSDFRSNLGLGGRGEPIDLPAEVRDICERAAAALGLDYCGADVLLGNEYLLCEVNSNAFFGGIERVTGVNVAGLYAEHIIKEIY